ncbi:hypothetical protein FB45DRAFT_1110224 [Roridomyces roridus]|uniref:Uncharacterized protein n=1 Tax=Roridomyces roridus TaxID=1738132 RepID=A0AAD7B978_9AGAR|nr:hypothetical protein FB45DRAFT_1110224 [Roridomyces roridus]
MVGFCKSGSPQELLSSLASCSAPSRMVWSLDITRDLRRNQNDKVLTAILFKRDLTQFDDNYPVTIPGSFAAVRGNKDITITVFDTPPSLCARRACCIGMEFDTPGGCRVNAGCRAKYEEEVQDTAGRPWTLGNAGNSIEGSRVAIVRGNGDEVRKKNACAVSIQEIMES